MWVLILLYFIAIVFEGTVTLIPVSFCLLLIFSISMRNITAFLLAFLGGLLLDLFFLRPLGLTSGISVILLFLLFLYERKYEISSTLFVFAASFFGCLLYLLALQQTHIFFRSVLASLIGISIYVVYKRFFHIQTISTT